MSIFSFLNEWVFDLPASSAEFWEMLALLGFAFGFWIAYKRNAISHELMATLCTLFVAQASTAFLTNTIQNEFLMLYGVGVFIMYQFKRRSITYMIVGLLALSLVLAGWIM